MKDPSYLPFGKTLSRYKEGGGVFRPWPKRPYPSRLAMSPL